MIDETESWFKAIESWFESNGSEKLDLDELKTIYIRMAKDAISADEDCSQYVFNKALEDLEVSINRVNDLIRYSRERVALKQQRDTES